MSFRLPQLGVDPCWFPAPSSACVQPDGLLAFGGDLSTVRLQHAYQQGIFPWFSEGDPLLWWSPSIRALFPPNAIKLGRSLAKYQRKYQFTFSCNHAFAQVIGQCASTRANSGGTWITKDIQQAYRQLHETGLAHSVEVWRQGQLVGGLYGLQIGQLFCGESMFNLEPNTARLALFMLQQLLQSVGAGWIDCQLPNPFLVQCGATPMARPDYLILLDQLKLQPVSPNLWQPRTLEYPY